MDLTARLCTQLNLRKSERSYRQLSSPSGLTDFASNDYLGLANNVALSEAISEKTHHLHQNGSTGSRLLSGNSAYTEEVEEQLAHIFNAEKALIFNSGYVANLAVLSSLPQRGDTIIYDELSHASLKDGARLSMANRFTFKHNDLGDLKKKLARASGAVFIVVEAIYSMDGDECPLKALTALAQEHKAHVILDEAHATGSMGPGGSGLSGALGITGDIFARIYTFGKGMGIHGAAIAGSATLINYLINFARPFIYTTSLPPHAIGSIDCAFAYLAANIHLQKELSTRVAFFNRYFKQKIGTTLKKTPGEHPVQGIIIPGNDAVKEIAHGLQQAGYDVKPVLSPTVRKNEERLRICLHTFNTNEEISGLIDSLASLR